MYKVPAVYWNLTTDRVLTMEYCEGGQVNDKEYIMKNRISPEQVNSFEKYFSFTYQFFLSI